MIRAVDVSVGLFSHENLDFRKGLFSRGNFNGRRRLFVLAVVLSAMVVVASAPGRSLAQKSSLAQKKSVRPGINKSFRNPDVKKFISRFERDGREAYAKRQEILAACGVKAGMTVADVGAGTGLFTRLFSRSVGPKGKVYAVDIAKNFLNHIQRMAKSEPTSPPSAAISIPPDCRRTPWTSFLSATPITTSNSRKIRYAASARR